MTVAELIEKFKEFPPEAEIIVIPSIMEDARYVLSWQDGKNNLKKCFRIKRNSRPDYTDIVITYENA